jgi:predicted MFS family arabinose efflux permease
MRSGLILPCNIAASVPSQAFSVFLPIIVKDLGYASYRANLAAVPIFLTGAVGLWIFAWHSDRKQERGFHILVSLLFVFVGLVMVANIKSSGARYAALCILQIGSYSAPPLTVAWLANNTPAPGKRALVLGLNGWGNLAGVIGSQLFRPSYAPRYHTPFLVCLGINIFSIVGYASYKALLIYVNKKRERIVENMTPEEIKEELTNSVRLGDKKLTFRFAL